jgi:hypothetical protein
MRVRVPVRLPHPDLSHGYVIDPKPSAGPLVPGAEPDLAGHPGREREGTDFTEIVRQQIFVKHIRVDVVPHDPDLHKHRVAGLEGDEVVREVRVVRVFLPPVAHPLREFLCFADCGDRAFAAGHSGTVGGGGLKGLWLREKMPKPELSAQIR